MKEVCIIGAGELGRKVAFYIKQNHSEAKIILIEPQDYTFSHSSFFTDLTQKNKYILSIAEAASKIGAELVKAELERININQRRLYFKNQPYLNFQALVIACGAKAKPSKVKGMLKEGVFLLPQFNPIVFRDSLKIADVCVIYASTLLGLKLALSLNKLGKEIKLFLDDKLSPIKDFFDEEGIDSYCGVKIEEAIGEGMLKAVKVSSPKVFAAQMLILDFGFMPNISAFSDTVLAKEEAVNIDDYLETPEKGIFCGGMAADKFLSQRLKFSYYQDIIEQQAKAIAQNIFSKEITAHFPMPVSFNIEDDLAAFKEKL